MGQWVAGSQLGLRRRGTVKTRTLENHKGCGTPASEDKSKIVSANLGCPTRPPWSSISSASPGSPENPPGPGVRRPAWVRSRHNVAVAAPKSSARTALPACGSTAGLVGRELRQHPRAREFEAAFAALAGQLLSAASLLLPAKDASALPRATLSIGPVLVGSRPCAPFPCRPPATHETGHFYFAQTGHSHFAATDDNSSLT